MPTRLSVVWTIRAVPAIQKSASVVLVVRSFTNWTGDFAEQLFDCFSADADVELDILIVDQALVLFFGKKLVLVQVRRIALGW